MKVELIQRLMRSVGEWSWGSEQQKAYDRIREELVSVPLLSYPLPDHKGWIVDTDASNHAICAVLSQVQAGEEKVVAYASHNLTDTQQRYCVMKKELLALKWHLRSFVSTCMDAGLLSKQITPACVTGGVWIAQKDRKYIDG